MFLHIVTDGSFILYLLHVHHMFCFAKNGLLSKVDGGLILSVMLWVRWKHLVGGKVVPSWGEAQHSHAERSHGPSKRGYGNVHQGWKVPGSWAGRRSTASPWRCLEKIRSQLRRDSVNIDTAEEGTESCWAADKSGVKGQSRTVREHRREASFLTFSLAQKS